MVNTPFGRKLCLSAAAIVLSGVGYASLATAQSSTDKVGQYVSVLNRISDAKLSIAQKEAYVANQKSQIESLRAQIKNVGATKKTVAPMISKMLTAIEGEMNSDFPFKEAERFNRLADVQETVADSSASVGEKMRKVLNIYDIETGYGNSVSAYAGNHPNTDKAGTRLTACLADELSSDCGLGTDVLKKMGYKDGVKIFEGPSVDALSRSIDSENAFKDGNYLHYGRLAFIYVQHDSSEAWRYDKDNKTWVELSGADILNARRSVRIAKGESAPGVITAPIGLQE